MGLKNKVQRKEVPGSFSPRLGPPVAVGEVLVKLRKAGDPGGKESPEVSAAKAEKLALEEAVAAHEERMAELKTYQETVIVFLPF